MTRRQLISEVNRQCSFTNKDGVEYILRLLEQTIIDNLIKGHAIKLNGFLKFGVKEALSREVVLEGKKFKTDKKLKAYVKVSPTIQRKIQEYQEQQVDMDWLEEFAELPYDMQYDLVKIAKEQANGLE